jgi:hypothetical protein
MAWDERSSSAGSEAEQNSFAVSEATPDLKLTTFLYFAEVEVSIDGTETTIAEFPTKELGD